MQTTRGQILQILQRRRGDTVAALARALGLAPATVRRHMDILQRDGLVTFRETRKGAGRPEHCFSLTEQGHAALPKGYDALLSDLMLELKSMPADQVSGMDGSKVLESTITRLGRRVAGEYRGRNGHEPVQAAMQALRERNFDPEVSNSPDGLRITLGNCPFRSVALTTQAVCAYDAAILSAILRAPVKLQRCITDGHECCEYVARSKNPRSAARDRANSGAAGGRRYGRL